MVKFVGFKRCFKINGLLKGLLIGFLFDVVFNFTKILLLSFSFLSLFGFFLKVPIFIYL